MSCLRIDRDPDDDNAREDEPGNQKSDAEGQDVAEQHDCPWVADRRVLAGRTHDFEVGFLVIVKLNLRVLSIEVGGLAAAAVRNLDRRDSFDSIAGPAEATLFVAVRVVHPGDLIPRGEEI